MVEIHDLHNDFDPRCPDCRLQAWGAGVRTAGLVLRDLGRWVRRRTWSLGGSRVGVRR